jgi:Uma2 family endonuclease
MVDCMREVQTMSVITQPTPPPAADDAAVPTEPIYRLSVAQYHAMAGHGILTEDDPVELLEGWLVQKMKRYRPHTLMTGLVRRALEGLPSEGWYIDSHEPITTADSEPEPDVIVIRGDPDDYPDFHPGPDAVALVVEVADSTLRRDRTIKKRIYAHARARIPIYWIANLIESRFEVYTDPTGPAEQPDYRQRQEYGPDDEIPVVLDGVVVGRLLVRDLLP